jgi:hypothetical protein
MIRIGRTAGDEAPRERRADDEWRATERVGAAEGCSASDQ